MPKPSTDTKKRSSASVDRAFRQLLQVLPAEWKGLMSELGAFVYGNKIRSPEELMRVILLYCGPDLALLELSLVMRLGRVEISAQALDKRLKRCAQFLEWLVKEALGMEPVASVPEGRRYLACDGTELSRRGPHSARLRLHLCIDLLSLGFVQAQLTGVGQGETLKRFKFQAGDVVLGDRAYCRYQSVLYVVHDCGADVLVRWNPSFPVYESRDAEQPMDLQEMLQGKAQRSLTSFPVFIKYSKKSSVKNKRELSGYLHIYKMTKDEAERSQRKLLRNYKRKNRTLNPKNAFLSQFVILFTTVAPLELSTEGAIALYRCRWQIELAFKNLKTLLDIKKLRAHPDSQLARLYIWGKLLYLLLIDRKVRSCFEQDWTSLGSSQRRLTLWRPIKLIKRQLDATLLQSHRWKPQHIASCSEALASAPRLGRPLQTLPAKVLRLAVPSPLAPPQSKAPPHLPATSNILPFPLLPCPPSPKLAHLPCQLFLDFGELNVPA
jgi:hypothetical protein